MAFSSHHKIRFDNVDGAGIVYYPHFFHLCHATMEDLIDAEGPTPYAELICEHRRGFPTVAVESSFSAPLAFGDSALVELSVVKVGNSSVVFRFEIRRAHDKEPCFRGTITTVFSDLDAKRALPLPEAWRAVFERHGDAS